MDSTLDKERAPESHVALPLSWPSCGGWVSSVITSGGPVGDPGRLGWGVPPGLGSVPFCSEPSEWKLWLLFSSADAKGKLVGQRAPGASFSNPQPHSRISTYH